MKVNAPSSGKVFLKIQIVDPPYYLHLPHPQTHTLKPTNTTKPKVWTARHVTARVDIQFTMEKYSLLKRKVPATPDPHLRSDMPAQCTHHSESSKTLPATDRRPQKAGSGTSNTNISTCSSSYINNRSPSHTGTPL